MKSTLVVAIALLSACSGTPVVDPVCTRDGLEEDFLPGELSGSAVDATGKLKPPAAGTTYVISSTYLRLPKSEAATKRFNALMGPILAALPTQDGLVANQFGSSEKCTVARTLSVWRDEAAMYGFVAGEAHAAAMGDVSEVSRGGSLVTHWAGPETEVTWEVARTRLGADDGPQY